MKPKFWLLDDSSLLIIGLFALMVSCSTYRVLEPKRGVTDQLLNTPVYGQPIEMGYGFDAFDSSMGLFIFSYEVTGANYTEGRTPNNKTVQGVRIWEYNFKDKDPDIVERLEKIDLQKESIGLNTLSKSRTELIFRIHRGYIVYGGRYVVDLRDKGQGVRIEHHFMEDCSQLVNRLETAGINVPVITDDIRCPARGTKKKQ